MTKVLSQREIENIPVKRGRHVIGPPVPKHLYRTERYGMRCPQCNSLNIFVTDSRGIKRRRMCRDCYYKYTTVEVVLGDVKFSGVGDALEKLLTKETKKRMLGILHDAIKYDPESVKLD